MTANWANHRINDHQSSAPVIPADHQSSRFAGDPHAHRVSCSQFTIHISQFSGILPPTAFPAHNSHFTVHNSPGSSATAFLLTIHNSQFSLSFSITHTPSPPSTHTLLPR